MIPRYEIKEISTLWTDESKFATFLKVELAILKALEGNLVPTGTTDAFSNVKIDPVRIAEIEETTRHDVIAFCSSITEQVDPKWSKFFHYGVTSSDIIDTSLSLTIRDSLDIILLVFTHLRTTLWNLANEWMDVIAMGRSHGMSAEPLSFGQKILGFYAEFSRRQRDLEDFYRTELTAKFSGTVGNYTILSPEHEAATAKVLGLKVEPVSTQIIPRDRIAKLITINALIAGAIERLAVEIRHLHRTEVNEVVEGFKIGQKGSSAMPHKKNPISFENLTGIARVLRSHSLIAMENAVLWHERDISHSSAERLFLPDNLGLLCYSLWRLDTSLNALALNKEEVENKVRSSFIYLSSIYLHMLLASADIKREEAYFIIQKASFAAKDGNSFRQMILDEAKSKGFVIEGFPSPSMDEIRQLYMGHTEEVFAKVAEEYPLR